MGVRERREREKDRLRQEILDAARELFVTEGFEHVSMRRIAAEIEYSPTTIYLYFKDKTELFNSICEEAFSRLAARLEKISREDGDSLVKLHRGCRAYVDFGLKHPHHYRLVFIDSSVPFSGKTLQVNAPSAGERAFDNLRQAVQACVAEGYFPLNDVEIMSQAVWSALHGVTSLLISRPDFPWVARSRLVNLTIDAMIRGLQTSEGDSQT